MLWGGRFKEQLNEKALRFSSSLKVDINLILEDIEGSIAHASMLSKTGIISAVESKKIIDGLEKTRSDWENRKWVPDPDKFEDIHSAVEARLFEIIGETAGKLHTGRSRNDQIATDIKLWIRNASLSVVETITKLQSGLLELASKHTDSIIPGYTHLQRAQPVSLAFHLLAYFEMLERDKTRFNFVRNSSNESPLGSGALAGSTLPLDRDFTAGQLGFDKITENALDAVSNRDFILDFLHAASVGMMHLSRLSEEIILWSTSEWGFLKLGDSFTTGSSLMPQKKNPDMAELIRGKTGRVYGNYIALSTTMKSLPLSYNRDLQEDKEPLFDSYFTLSNSLEIMAGMLATAEFKPDKFKEILTGDLSLATDLADWLVLKGIPFREAHHIIGEVVKKLEESNSNFTGITVKFLKEINQVFDESALKCLEIETSLKRKKTAGSPNPDMVKSRIEILKNGLKNS